jgi:hypothetical protein
MSQNIPQQVSKIAPMNQPIRNMNNSPYANIRESINPNILNSNMLNSNITTQQTFSQNLNTNLEMDNLRRTQINEHLNHMKEQVKKMNVSDDSDKPKYKNGLNVKRRGIDVDTSSSETSNKSDKSDKSDKTDKSNDTSNTDNYDIKNSKTSNSENFKSKIKVMGDKSLNSKNNASSFSKRKYRRNPITISTE